MNNERVAWIAFAGSRRIAVGEPSEVAAAVKARVDADPETCVLVFDQYSSEPVELDLRGSLEAVLSRVPPSASDHAVREEVPAPDELAAPPVRTAGRPKLGVVAREITLLPRHWAWLSTQSGGASVALRKLVEQALRSGAVADRVRKTRESTYRFMTAVAGNEANHEEAIRALFAGDLAAFDTLIDRWPVDVREHVMFLARSAEADR